MRELRFLALALPIALAVACAKLPTASRHSELPYRIAQAEPSPQASIDEVLAAYPFLTPAHLTADQRNAILALLQQQPTPNESTLAQQDAQWKALMSAPTLDTAALKAFLQARASEAQTQQQQAMALLGKVRDVLTDQQRSAVAAGIRQVLAQAKQAPQPPQAMPSPEESPPPGPDLNLTADQQALFEAATPSPNPSAGEASLQALATFMGGGDLQAFAAANAPDPNADKRLDALIKAYASLSQQQRTTLVNYQPPQPSPGPEQGG